MITAQVSFPFFKYMQEVTLSVSVVSRFDSCGGGVALIIDGSQITNQLTFEAPSRYTGLSQAHQFLTNLYKSVYEGSP